PTPDGYFASPDNRIAPLCNRGIQSEFTAQASANVDRSDTIRSTLLNATGDTSSDNSFLR
ncbi:hypothetical protein, partial [Stenotrophomonas maltophilia]